MSVNCSLGVTCGCAGVALVLQGDQREVDAFPLQELTVSPPLHRLSVLKANNHVCVPDGGEPVGNGNGCPACAHLHSLVVIEVSFHTEWLCRFESVVGFLSTFLTLSRASCTTASLSLSKADVAISRSRIRGFRIRARAIAILCFCPPLICPPPSPTRVSNFWPIIGKLSLVWFLK